MPPYKTEQPKIKKIKEVKEFMNALSEKGYKIYPDRTLADFYKDFDNYSEVPITKIIDQDIKPRKVVIRGRNIEIMLHNYCHDNHLANKVFKAGITGYIKLRAENKNKFFEIESLIKNCWKLRPLSEFEI